MLKLIAKLKQKYKRYKHAERYENELLQTICCLANLIYVYLRKQANAAEYALITQEFKNLEHPEIIWVALQAIRRNKTLITQDKIFICQELFLNVQNIEQYLHKTETETETEKE